MRKLVAFENISLDGYFTDGHQDMSWANAGSGDPEFSDFVAANARGSALLIFGRITYELMAGFWPTPAAMQAMPAVAERINAGPKLVFSKTLKEASWNNTALTAASPAAEIARLKRTPGPDMTILGSGSVVSQLSQARLIDEYQLVVNPVILGSGRALFEGVKDRFSVKLKSTRTFQNGKVFLVYASG
jgi:dihydrofolate reductase